MPCCAASDVVRQHIREPQDFPGPLGVREFVVVCHGCKAPPVCPLAEKIRKLIEESVFEGELRHGGASGWLRSSPARPLSTLFTPPRRRGSLRAKGEGLATGGVSRAPAPAPTPYR